MIFHLAQGIFFFIVFTLTTPLPYFLLSQSMVVKVTDLEGKPLAKEDINFTREPGGNVHPFSDRANNEGTCSVRVTFGLEDGMYTITATCQGVSMSTDTIAASSGG